jgi:hypothetical protein
MQDAEVSVVLSWLPALFMIATINLGLLNFVLSEVKAFSWEHLRSNRNLKVFIRDETIFIKVESVKNIFEFVF